MKKVNNFIGSIKLIIVILFVFIFMMSGVSIFSVIGSAFADSGNKQKDDSNLPANNVYNAFGAETDFCTEDNLVSKLPYTENSLPTDGVINTTTSVTSIYQSLVAEEPFSIDGTITTNNGTYNLNEFYDFSNSSKFAIH